MLSDGADSNQREWQPNKSMASYSSGKAHNGRARLAVSMPYIIFRAWFKSLEKYLTASAERMADKAFHVSQDIAQRERWLNWHPISTAPYNQELELRIADGAEVVTLDFPCLKTNLDAWINVDLGTEIEMQPVEWRLWQRQEPLESHHSKINLADRSAFFHPHHRPANKSNSDR